MAVPSPYKNAMGKLYTKALFFEEAIDSERAAVLYTLKDYDHQGFRSLYRLYMETADLTEYKFALAYLDGWEHWQQLCACSWFKPFVTRWRQELEIKYRSEALANIIEVARTPKHASSFQANRFLLDSGWKPPEKNKRGRPSDDDIKAEVRRAAAERLSLDEDEKRVFLAN